MMEFIMLDDSLPLLFSGSNIKPFLPIPWPIRTKGPKC